MANTTITNCTPHDVNIVGEDGSVVATIPASGILPRCQATIESVDVADVDGVTIPLTASTVLWQECPVRKGGGELPVITDQISTLVIHPYSKL